METTTATISGHTLRDLLTGCLIAAGKDNTVQALTGVNVSWEDGDNHITGAGTDRYRLIVGAGEGVTTGAGAFTLPRIAVAELIKLLPKPAKYPLDFPKVTITPVDDERVSFTIVGTDITLNQKYRTRVGEYPRYKSLIPDYPAFGASTGVKEMAWDPAYMASFDKVPRRSGTPIKWRFTESHRPMVGTVVHDFIAWTLLLMPVRLTGSSDLVVKVKP